MLTCNHHIRTSHVGLNHWSNSNGEARNAETHMTYKGSHMLQKVISAKFLMLITLFSQSALGSGGSCVGLPQSCEWAGASQCSLYHDRGCVSYVLNGLATCGGIAVECHNFNQAQCNAVQTCDWVAEEVESEG